MTYPRYIAILLFCCCAVPVAAQTQWEFRTPMDAPRAGVASAVLDGKIYVVGGLDQFGNVLDQASRYDPRADHWEHLPAIGTARANAAAVVSGGMVFVIGGRDGSGKVLDDVEFYDPAENRWRSFESLDEERQGLAAVLRNASIFVAGGSNEEDEILESIEVYDETQGTWVEFEEDDDDDEGEVEEVEVTGEIEGIGGSSLTVEGLTFAVTDTTEIRDAAGDDATLSDLSVGQEVEVRGVLLESGELIATRIRAKDDGGGSGSAASKQAETESLSTPRAAFAAVTVGERVVIVGGFGRRGPLDLVEQLGPGGQFETLPPLPSARGSLAAAVVNDSVFVLGGRDGSDRILADVQLLDLSSGTWRAMPRLNIGRESFTAAAVDGVLFVFGGRDASGRVLDDVEAFGQQNVAVEQPPTSLDFHLAQNYPNPFRTGTTITFRVSARASIRRVALAVYDMQGRRVAVLVDGILAPGEHIVSWDGRGRGGMPVSSGVYFYRLHQGDLVARKMMAIVH